MTATAAPGGSPAPSYVGQYIHYDWQGTTVTPSDAGLTKMPIRAQRRRTHPTQLIDGADVLAVIQAPFPEGVANFSNPIPAGTWRLIGDGNRYSLPRVAGQYHFDPGRWRVPAGFNQVYPIGGGVSIQLQFPAIGRAGGAWQVPGVWESR